MSDRFVLEFEAELPNTLEAMTLAGRDWIAGRTKLLLGVQQFLLVVLAPLGAVLIYMMIRFQVTGRIVPDAAWPYLLIGLGTSTLAILSLRGVQRAFGRVSVNSRFSEQVGAEIDKTGLTLIGTASRWHTDWSDVESVLRGKRVLAVRVGGVAISVPISAFDTPAEAEDAYQKMRIWHAEAVSAGMPG